MKRSHAARHSKKDPNWTTPPEELDVIRAIYRHYGNDQIDLDPMSSKKANEVVQARRFFTKKDDCFKQLWETDAMSINPAGGLIVRAWGKLVDEFLAGRTKRALWVGFSVEQICLLADREIEINPLSFSTVFLRKRIKFVKERDIGKKKRKGSPSHSNFITGIGIDRWLFEMHYGHRGHIVHGERAMGMRMEDRQRIENRYAA